MPASSPDVDPQWPADPDRLVRRRKRAVILVLGVAAAAAAVVLAIALRSDTDSASPTTVAAPWQPDVIEHEFGELGNTPAANVWTGVIYRVADGTPVFLAEGVNPLGMPLNSALTMTVEAEERRDSGFRLRVLHRVVGDPPPASGLSSAVEMVWTSGAGIDGSFELDAALQRPAGTAYTFHLQCVTETGETVVAVVDTDLEAQAAWALTSGGTYFDEVSAANVTCW